MECIVPLDWERIREQYHARWNLTKPLLAENSPPEVLHAGELNATFSPRGNVRFLLITRSACLGDAALAQRSKLYATASAVSVSVGNLF